jgi:hypothetical protein
VNLTTVILWILGGYALLSLIAAVLAFYVGSLIRRTRDLEANTHSHHVPRSETFVPPKPASRHVASQSVITISKAVR